MRVPKEIRQNGVDCRMCIHYRRNWILAITSIGVISPNEFAECGCLRESSNFAKIARKYSMGCGPEGQYFQKKK